MERKTFSIRLDESVMKTLRHLAIDAGKPLGTLLEEAIQDLLQKYGYLESAKPKKTLRRSYAETGAKVRD